ncbi:hypothetical protein HOLleu_43372 [Holothuria leucospilota]|uniref:Uncharacterized protein n=1 Tax=Holothuria leucospilota TaxID=206669 RepID=A0A9Q0Y9R6_HOLLE|nr:hypothetical protein HOLleu_43372 [Holothuria leucospilota]
MLHILLQDEHFSAKGLDQSGGRVYYAPVTRRPFHCVVIVQMITVVTSMMSEWFVEVRIVFFRNRMESWDDLTYLNINDSTAQTHVNFMCAMGSEGLYVKQLNTMIIFSMKECWG